MEEKEEKLIQFSLTRAYVRSRNNKWWEGKGRAGPILWKSFDARLRTSLKK